MGRPAERNDRMGLVRQLCERTRRLANALSNIREDAFAAEASSVPTYHLTLAVQTFGERMYQLSVAAELLVSDPSYTEEQAWIALHGDFGNDAKA